MSYDRKGRGCGLDRSTTERPSVPPGCVKNVTPAKKEQVGCAITEQVDQDPPTPTACPDHPIKVPDLRVQDSRMSPARARRREPGAGEATWSVSAVRVVTQCIRVCSGKPVRRPTSLSSKGSPLLEPTAMECKRARGYLVLKQEELTKSGVR